MGWAIALQGGAGDIPRTLPTEHSKTREAALRHFLAIGVDALKAGKSPLDVVELVVRELENNPHFNAGRGSVLTSEGTVEMEASIMDGNTKRCGAVSGLTTVVNPISLARLVMEKTPHIYLAFDGAEKFAREQVCCLEVSISFLVMATIRALQDWHVLPSTGIGSLSAREAEGRTNISAGVKGVETVDPNHFITPQNIERLKQAKEANTAQLDYTQPIQKDVKKETPNTDGDSQIGTVGCVAVDNDGNLAAATSTGGFVNKMVGRIGDTPIIGAGTYANNHVAVSATGKGEAIMRGTVARDVAALMEFKGLSLKEAAAYVVEESVPRGNVGLVAVSAKGEVTMALNTTGMFRACATEDGYSEIAIWPSVQN